MGMAALRLAVVLSTALGIPAPGGAGGPPGPEEVRARVDAYLAPLVEAGLFSGAVLLARGGEVAVEKAWGQADAAAEVPNTPATRFKLMSVSKSITAVAVMRLVQAGRLDLADPVRKSLERWPAPWKGVTVHHLLDHTSGIPNVEGEWTSEENAGPERGLEVWKRLAPRLADRPLETAAGTRSAYSNFNYVLVGLVLEAAGGRPYPEVLRREVLEPAGMALTGLDDGSRRPGLSVGCFRRNGVAVPGNQDMSRIQAAGGIFSTVGDLWRLDRALRGEALLRSATREAMLTPTPPGGSYACGWMVSPIAGRPCVHHSGGANGYVAEFFRFPEDDGCVVVLSNFAFAPITRIGEDLAAILFGMECAAPLRLPAAALDAAVGVYRSPGAAAPCFVLRRSGPVLSIHQVFEAYGTCLSELALPVGADPLVLPWGRDRLRLVPPEGGRGAGLRLEHENGAMSLDRVPFPAAPWRGAAGEYRMGPGPGGAARIEEGRDGLLLALPGLPDPLSLVPLTDSLALALDPSDFGTLLALDRDPGGRAVRFRWTRRPGDVVEGVRAGGR